jgi:hypothetical protein
VSRQYFIDTPVDPLGVALTTISAITETVLVPIALTPIGANEARAGKIWKLRVGGTCTTGLAGTLIITPRFGLTSSGAALGASPTQNYVPSISNAPFYFEYTLICRALGLPGANSSFVGSGIWVSGGAVATAASATTVCCSSTASVSADASVASALWIGVTFSVAPSVIPHWHVWQSEN